MPLRIPSIALPGLEALSNFDESQIKTFIDYLRSAPAGMKMDDISSFLNTELNVLNAHQIVQTLISFRTLLEPSNVNFDKLSFDLTTAYKGVTSKEEKNLQHNLSLIFENSNALKLTLKADTLLSYSDTIYSESKIITDIRIVFNDDLNERNRNAILVHRLNIEYNTSNETKDFYVSMTLADLKNLKDVIERAILKENIINKDYSKEFTFINSSINKK